MKTDRIPVYREIPYYLRAKRVYSCCHNLDAIGSLHRQLAEGLAVVCPYLKREATPLART
ncbi:MAG: hypothetical protein ACYTGW_03165 [Planctomycetota bacterium]